MHSKSRWSIHDVLLGTWTGLLIASTMTMLAACDNRNPKANKKSETSRVPRKLEDATMLTVTPLADGGAYVSSMMDGVWYVRGIEAARVELDHKGIGLSIMPTIDGGAYATSFGRGHVWYLRGTVATPLKEVDHLDPAMAVENAQVGLWLAAEARMRDLRKEQADGTMSNHRDMDFDPNNDYRR